MSGIKLFCKQKPLLKMLTLLFCKQKPLQTFLEKSFTKNHQDNNENNIEFTADPSRIKQADFVLICVPTPVTKSNLRSQTYAM